MLRDVSQPYKDLFSRISIVLVEPENSDNIGACARAMKNMGFYNLRLVKPPRDWEQTGRKMAMRARDVLERAEVYPTLRGAIRDACLVIGTTRRSGAKRGAFLSFAETIKKIKKVSQKKPVAIVFGKESKGLDNKSLGTCDWVTTIPTGPAYPSINLAQAVMLVVFSLLHSKIRKETENPSHGFYVSKKVTQDVLRRLGKALRVLGYEREGAGVLQRILVTFHGLLKRNGLLQSEAQMLRGISRRIGERIGR
jgi:TrmH family RNA methyltransferase